MNTEDFATYEQAVALRKLGFDWKCTHYYYNEKLYEYSPKSYSYYFISFDFNYNEYLDSDLNEDLFEDFISAPTLAQVQKWILKNKNYYVSPNWDIDKDLWVVDIKTKDEIIEVLVDDNPFFSSYEEALLTGITECIKLLEMKLSEND